MRRYLLHAFAAAVLTLASTAAAAQDFSWHGAVAQGQAIEIKGVNGNLRAEPAGGNDVEVVAQKRARRDNPADVRIEVVPHAGGVTICAVYPAPSGSAPNECRPGSEGRNSVRNNDVQVDFTIRVPAGVRFVGRTVNGEIAANRLNGDLALTTVNGSINFSTTGVARATTVNGSIRGAMGRADWTDTLELSSVNGGITLTLPSGIDTEVRASTVNGDIDTEFPITIGRVTRRRVEGTIGAGGRQLSLESVNGSITLKKE
jgi:hypothetical protein